MVIFGVELTVTIASGEFSLGQTLFLLKSTFLFFNLRESFVSRPSGGGGFNRNTE